MWSCYELFGFAYQININLVRGASYLYKWAVCKLEEEEKENKGRDNNENSYEHQIT